MLDFFPIQRFDFVDVIYLSNKPYVKNYDGMLFIHDDSPVLRITPSDRPDDTHFVQVSPSGTISEIYRKGGEKEQSVHYDAHTAMMNRFLAENGFFPG